jgi:putative SOS response-associated peptidase YedK
MKDTPLFAIAGLFDRWKASDGTELATFTLITTGPNTLISPLHDRMPAILRKEDEDAWIGHAIPDPAWQSRALHPYPADEMIAYPVSTMVNSPGNEGEELIKPEASLDRWKQGG